MTKTSNPLAAALSWRLRGGTDDDIGYVYETWSRAAWPLYQFETRLSVFRSYLKRYMARLIERDTTLLQVACDKLEPNLVYGWMMSTDDVIRFVYVRSSHRRAGIARAMATAIFGAGVDTFHTSSRLTPDANAIARNHDVVHTPFNER